MALAVCLAITWGWGKDGVVSGPRPQTPWPCLTVQPSLSRGGEPRLRPRGAKPGAQQAAPYRSPRMSRKAWSMLKREARDRWQGTSPPPKSQSCLGGPHPPNIAPDKEKFLWQFFFDKKQKTGFPGNSGTLVGGVGVAGPPRTHRQWGFGDSCSALPLAGGRVGRAWGGRDNSTERQGATRADWVESYIRASSESDVFLLNCGISSKLNFRLSQRRVQIKRRGIWRI